MDTSNLTREDSGDEGTYGPEVWYCLTDEGFIIAGCEGHGTIDGHCPGHGVSYARDADDDTLGPCGCRDYHMADCDTVNGSAWYWDRQDDMLDPYYD